MSMNRLVDVNDTGDNLSGTPHTNEWLQDLQDRIDAALGFTMYFANQVGTQNNLVLSPAAAEDRYVEWSGTSTLILTGVAGGRQGDRLWIKNVSANGSSIFIPNLANGQSSGANLFYNTAISGATPIAPKGYARYVHDGSFWVMVGHEQGAWITETFSAANYTTNTGAAWTVQSTDELQRAYRLDGRTLHVGVLILNTTVGAAPTALRMTIPGGFQSSKYSQVPCGILDNGDAARGYLGFMITNPGTVPLQIEFYHPLSSTTWEASTNSSNVAGTMAFEVL